MICLAVIILPEMRKQTPNQCNSLSQGYFAIFFAPATHANGGDATLSQSAIPEDKADQHADQRNIGPTDPSGLAYSHEGCGQRIECEGQHNGSESISAQQITCLPPSLRDSFAPSA